MTPWLRLAVVFGVGVAGTAVAMQLTSSHDPTTESSPPTLVADHDVDARYVDARYVVDEATRIAPVNTSTPVPTVTGVTPPSLPETARSAEPANTDTPVQAPIEDRFDEPVEVHTDDHDHPDIAPPDETAAAVVAVAMFSWRFDDEPDRLERTIGDVATSSVVASLQPDPIEAARRVESEEVSWAIVVDHTVDATRHEITLTRRWLTTTDPEATETRRLTLMVVNQEVLSVVEHRSETP